MGGNLGKIGLFCLAAATLSAACGPNPRILESANSNSVPSNRSGNSAAPANTPSLEQDIAAMRDADFYFIYVFRRKDRGELDADDRRFMASVIPDEINRKTISDGGRALVTGSNFRFPPEAWKEMTSRYDFEDHSRPESEIMGANANTGPKR